MATLEDLERRLAHATEWAEYLSHRFKVYDGGSAISAIARGDKPPQGETLEERLLARAETAERELEETQRYMEKMRIAYGELVPMYKKGASPTPPPPVPPPEVTVRADTAHGGYALLVGTTPIARTKPGIQCGDLRDIKDALISWLTAHWPRTPSEPRAGEVDVVTKSGDAFVAAQDSPAPPSGDDSWMDEDPGECETCGKRYELVRPGKSQPTCDCHESPAGASPERREEVDEAAIDQAIRALEQSDVLPGGTYKPGMRMMLVGWMRSCIAEAERRARAFEREACAVAAREALNEQDLSPNAIAEVIRNREVRS